MAFLNEKKIPKEYLEKYGSMLESQKLKDASGSLMPAETIRGCSGWTVDYDRCIFLASFPHGYMELKSLQLFIFHWQNNIFYVEANREINRVANPRDINYYSVLFKPPIELEQQKSLFLGGLKEALKAYGTAGAFSGVESNVIFNW